MKVERVHAFGPLARRVSAMLYVSEGGSTALYLGFEDGSVSTLPMPSAGHSLKGVKEEELGLEGDEINRSLHHSSKVTALLFSRGMLFSGSSDRTVRVWMTTGRSFIQSLPHSSTVNVLADGHDGSILSVCMDGILKVWTPQKGREMMLSPFFVSTFQLRLVTVTAEASGWVSAMDVSSYGAWSVYIGDSEGCVSCYRKGNLNPAEIEDVVPCAAHPLERRKRWEKVHALGITHVKVLSDEGFLVVLASDGACKVMDAVLGATITSFSNPRRCSYTGLSWLAAETSLYLSDELGFLQVFNLSLEKAVGSAQVVKPSSKQEKNILHSHHEQTLGSLFHYHGHSFFSLVLPYTPRTVSATMSTQNVPGALKPRQLDLASNGDVLLLRVSSEATCRDFVGHEGPVVALSINTFWEGATSAASAAHGSGTTSRASAASSFSAAADATLRVSKEESAFFSIGSDMTIRCWDEFDASESYQFRSKSKHEFTALKMLWNMNSLATGHDDGTLVLWNSDAGTNVVSRGALRTSVTSIIEARSARSYFLAASDFSGRIALWNLTQFRLNPVSLPLESVLQSRHDSEEPGVLSLAFHRRFNAFFSGGVDLTIRAWRADQESCVTAKAHAEPVCCLEISDSFLLSADEGGEVFLWRITLDEFASGKSAPLPTLTALCRWFGARGEQPSRSVVALHEARDGGATVVQAGRGGTTWVWGVSFGHPEQAEGPGKGGEEEEEEKKDGGQEGKEEEKWNADKKEEEVVVRAVDLQKERGDDEEFRVALSSTRVSALSTIEHQQDYEVACVQLSCSDTGVPRCLYLGTSEGPVKRISLSV